MSKVVSKTNALTIIVTSESLGAKGSRADRVLSAFAGLPSRSQLKHWFDEGRIRRNGQAIEASSNLHAGDEIKVFPPDPKRLELEPRLLKLDIFFEDDDLLVLMKPRGLTMHPGAGTRNQTTLAHALVAHSKSWSARSGEFRPGIVHRLDKDTEGIVVIAKNDSVHDDLQKQFAERSIDRNYWALVMGKPPLQFDVDAPIGRHPKNRKKMGVISTGKPARTSFRRLKYFEEGYAWVECKLHSGRTHQIRVHLSSKGYPILRDPVYGKGKLQTLSYEKEKIFDSLHGQALIAFRLGFVHPRTKARMLFESEPPSWLKVLAELKGPEA